MSAEVDTAVETPAQVEEQENLEEVDSVDEVDEVEETEEADDTDATDEVEAEVEVEQSEGDREAARAAKAENRVKHLENEGEIAADYLEELLDIADLDGDLDMDVEGDRAAVSIVGADLKQLVGRDGEVLDALQELTRLVVYRETGERSRLMLDISGHRAEKREQLVKLADETATQVKETGESVSLDAMTPFERKVVHDAIAAAGLKSESEGVEPRRYVVVLPA